MGLQNPDPRFKSGCRLQMRGEQLLTAFFSLCGSRGELRSPKIRTNPTAVHKPRRGASRSARQSLMKITERHLRSFPTPVGADEDSPIRGNVAKRQKGNGEAVTSSARADRKICTNKNGASKPAPYTYAECRGASRSTRQSLMKLCGTLRAASPTNCESNLYCAKFFGTTLKVVPYALTQFVL